MAVFFFLPEEEVEDLVLRADWKLMIDLYKFRSCRMKKKHVFPLPKLAHSNSSNCCFGKNGSEGRWRVKENSISWRKFSPGFNHSCELVVSNNSWCYYPTCTDSRPAIFCSPHLPTLTLGVEGEEPADLVFLSREPEWDDFALLALFFFATASPRLKRPWLP